jgi:diacylglycerol kinase (ATP)
MRKCFQSFAHAFRGIREFIAIGSNARIQLLAAVVVGAAGFVFGFTPTEWIAVTLCIGAVLSAEAMNTAIEELANAISEERSERIRRVKDIAAGAVLVASLASVAVAAILVFQRL